MNRVRKDDRHSRGASHCRLPSIAGGLLAAIISTGAANPSFAESTGLAGSWSGGGTVTLGDGGKERARCRATYIAQSDTRYTMTGTCATESTRVAQTAVLRKVGANTYSGGFYNSEFGISGRIRVIVRGNTQTATLTSANGSAQLSMSK